LSGTVILATAFLFIFHRLYGGAIFKQWLDNLMDDFDG
jgi:hypothetical protein